jgi:chromosome segregation ATPase
MRRSWLLIPALLLLSAPISAQSAPTDSQTLQALLAEVRELRKDLETTAASGQRAQILLYRLQAQADAVRRAQQRLDDISAKLTGVQAREKLLGAQVKRIEEGPEGPQNSADQKEIQALLPQLKAELDSLSGEDQELQTKKIDAEQQLRLEQAKLSTLEAGLDQLESTLESADGRREANPQ